MHALNWIPQNSMIFGLAVLLVVLLVIFLVVFFRKNPKWILDRLGTPDKFQSLKFLGLSMGGVLFVIQIAISSGVNQNIEQGQRQERLKNAIEHLGHESDSMRLGGAYELFHLAEDTTELRWTAFDILCAHIRQTTSEAVYQEKHKSRPSEEIQSLLTLLFVQDHKVFEGLNINLQESWLQGAKLDKARLPGAQLEGAHLQGAWLMRANLQGAVLFGANLQNAQLNEAHLQGARLVRANLKNAWLNEAHLQGARLVRVNLQNVRLNEAHLQGTRLVFAQLQGAFLEKAQLQGASLRNAQLQGASLESAQLQGASLGSAQLQGASLEKAQLQGASLWGAQLQGASLEKAQLQGASLEKAQLQGASLERTQLQGVVSSGGPIPDEFAERMRKGIGRQSDLSKVVFEGGLIRGHVYRQASNDLPKNSGAVTGTYTEEEAEQWIAEYEGAMSEVPKAANGQ